MLRLEVWLEEGFECSLHNCPFLWQCQHEPSSAYHASETQQGDGEQTGQGKPPLWWCSVTLRLTMLPPGHGPIQQFPG